MDIFIVHPESEAQQKALELILDGLKIPYDNEPSVDREISDNVRAGLNEVRLFKQGKLNTTATDDFLNEL